MYRVIGTLRRSYACHLISKGDNLGCFWSLTERIKIGAGYYSNYAPNHSNVNKDLGDKQFGFTNKGLKRYDGTNNQEQRRESGMLTKPVGRKISAAEKRKFLINTLFDLKDSKQSVYGTLDAWVAMEPTFPLASLRQALVVLQKHEQWHRIVQVLKWILSKGQGNTMGTYKLLITALEKDNRAEEAHKIWKSKIGHDLHSVSWDFCDLMLSIYYRNNMLDRLVKLFRHIESYGRKPPRKSIVRKVADAYEVLGLSEEKDKLLKEYSYLFDKSSDENKRRYKHSKKTNKEDKKENSKVKSLNSMAVDSGPSDDQTQKQCSQNS
ncbi:pentatricopeptide repeat-containing protein At4g18975, chloroplastic-like isoform X1 [Carex rostrata]